MAPPEDQRVEADPALVEAWIKGWALARSTPAPVRDGGAFRVDVGWPEQQARYVFPRLDDKVRTLARSIADPWIYLKVCAAPEDVRPLLPERWVIQPPSFMMMASPGLSAPPLSLTDGYRFDRAQTASTVKVLAPGGDLAASGHIAVVDHFVIYDRIETHPDHQRRGLGRAVMAALASMGRARGATHGLLVATVAGRALYETLGWRVHSPYVSVVIPGKG